MGGTREGNYIEGRRPSVRDFSHRGALFGVVAVRATKYKYNGDSSAPGGPKTASQGREPEEVACGARTNPPGYRRVAATFAGFH